jgi:autotransporter-associated beta strand protein
MLSRILKNFGENVMSQTLRVSRLRIAAMIGCLVVAAFAASPAHAATRTWSVTTGTGVWQTGANWVDASAPANDTSTDTAYFSSGNGTQMVQLNANASIAGLTFAQTGSTQLTSSTTTVRTLTIGSSGITVNAGAGAVLFASTVSPQISGNQQWVNNSSSLLRFSGAVQTATAGAQTLTIGGSGTTSFDRIADGVGTLSIVKTGAGTLTTAQTSGAIWTFTGSLAINEGLYSANGSTMPNVDVTIGSSGTIHAPNNAASFKSLAGSGRLTGFQVSVTGGSNTTFSGILGLGGALTNSGSGRLTLTGSNSGGAGLAVTGSNAEIVIGSPSALWYSSFSNAGSVTLNSGTLSFGTGVTSGTSNRLFGTGGVLNLTNADGNAVSYSTGNPNAAATFSGTSAASIIGLGSLRKHGNNTQILTGSNSYTGGTFVDSGILQIGNGGTTGSIVGNATMANATTLIFNRSDAISFSGTLSGAGSLRKDGAGTLTLSSSNLYAGTTTVSAGVLRLDNANALPGGIGATGGSSALTINGGVIGLGNGNFSRGLGTTASTVQITGGGGFAAYGADRTVNLGGSSGTATWGSGSFITTAGGTFVLGAADATNMVTFQNPIALGASDRTVRVDNGSADVDATLGGVISGAGGGLTKTGLGTLAMTAVNTYTGPTTVNGGVLAYGVTNALSDSTAVTVAGGGLNLGSYDDTVASFTITSGSLFGSGKLTAATYALGGGTVTGNVGGGAMTVTANSNLNGTADVTSVSLNAGALALGTAGRFTSNQVALTGSSGASISLGGNESIGSLNGGFNVALGSATLTTGNSNTNTTFSGTASGSGGLTKAGNGTFEMTAVNTYTGPTTISAGRMLFSGNGSLSGATGDVTVDGSGAELKWNSSNALTRALVMTQGTLSGTGTISAAGGVTIGTNATLSPGNSPGTQAFTTGLTLAAGGSYLWEINDWTGTQGVNPGWDLLAVSGSPLNITADSFNPFTIFLTSLTGSNSAGLPDNFSYSSNKTFTIATAGSLTGFSADKFSLNYTGWSGTAGTWSITGTDNALQLNYFAPVTNTPTTYTLASAANNSTIIVGGTSTITASVVNTGTGNNDSLNYTGLSVGNGVTLGTTSATGLAIGGTNTTTGAFTTGSAGSYTFGPVVATATNQNLGGDATLSGTTAATVTVLNHSNAALSLASGGAQTIITGGTFNAVTFNLTNAGANNAAVDVSGLVNLNGSTGSAVVASGGTASYTGINLSNTSVGVNNLVVSATAGDQQSLSGANSLTTISATTSYTVLDHATSSLQGSGVLTSKTLDLGTWDYVTQTWTSGTSSAGFSIFNLAGSNGDALTALLALTGGTSSGDTGFSTTLISSNYSLIAGGTSQAFSVAFDTTGISSSGLLTRTFTFNMADQQNLSGAAATNPLTVVANVVVVPEPGSLALAGIGIAAAAYAYRRRRRK